MAQDPDVLREYLAATREMEVASGANDRDRFVAASQAWADKAELYADDLDSNRLTSPHDIRADIRRARTNKHRGV